MLEKNKKCFRKKQEKVEETDEKGEITVVLADFNGHLGYLDEQEENKNGKQIKNLL